MNSLSLHKRTVALAFLLSIGLLSPGTWAERNPQAIPIKEKAGSQVGLYRESYALVVGVSDYRGGWPRLPGVKEDVKAVTHALEGNGFQVVKVEDPDQAALETAYKDFVLTYGLNSENRLLFYFAGHGYTYKPAYATNDPEEWMGYIVSRDAPLPTKDRAAFLRHAMSMQQFENLALQIEAKHVLFVFDSCFSGSIFSLSRAIPTDITLLTAKPVRQFLSSGGADQEVPDSSIFRRQFIAALEGEADRNDDGYVTGSELGQFLYEKVTNYSRGTQTPQYGKIRHPRLDKGDFIFSLQTARVVPPPVSPQPSSTEDDTQSRKTKEAAQSPPSESSFLKKALALVAPEKPESPSVSPPVAEIPSSLSTRESERQPEKGRPTTTAAVPALAQPPVHATLPLPQVQSTFVDSVGIEFVLIPAGEFILGSAEDVSTRDVHPVTISRPFYLGKYEVTQAQWMAVMGRNPSKFKGRTGGVGQLDDYVATMGNSPIKFTGHLDKPVERISWEDAQAFIRTLNAKEGMDRYRLPTEAEWEYAARAGTTTAYGFGDDEKQLGHYAWYEGNAQGETHPVGRLQPNAWGLYDMLGNVWEWCQDWYDRDGYASAAVVDPVGPGAGRFRVYRGCGWHRGTSPLYCQVANRHGAQPTFSHASIGFRLAMTVPQEQNH